MRISFLRLPKHLSPWVNQIIDEEAGRTEVNFRGPRLAWFMLYKLDFCNWQFFNQLRAAIGRPISSEQAINEILLGSGWGVMFFLDMLQQPVLIPELSLKRGRAMTDYLQATASFGSRQCETAHNQESTWLQCRIHGGYISSAIIFLGEKVEYRSIVP